MVLPVHNGFSSSGISLSDRLDECISRQHTLLIVAQEHQLQVDQHKVVENDTDVTDYPVNSYVLYTPPMGGSNKLLPKLKGRKQSIYIIEDLVKGKQIRTHVHNLQPFVFNPTQVNLLDAAQQNEQEFVVDGIVVEGPPWSS